MRPVSPYLSVYQPQIGSIFSIFGRITGIFIFVSLIVFLVMLDLKNSYLTFNFFYNLEYTIFCSSSALVSCFLFFLLLNIVYHLLFSLRYILWSFTGGKGPVFSLSLENTYKIAQITAIALFVITSFIWLVI